MADAWNNPSMTPEQLQEYYDTFGGGQVYSNNPAQPYNSQGSVEYVPRNLPAVAGASGYSSYAPGNNSFYGPAPFIYSPGAAAARQSAQLAAATQKAQAEAKAANEKRYNDILGSGSANDPLQNAIRSKDPAVLQAIAAGKPAVVINGKSYNLPKVPFRQRIENGKAVNEYQINGQWVDAKSVTPEMRIAAVTAQSSGGPLLGGYYGIYDRANANVANQRSDAAKLQSAYDNRTNTALSYLANAGKQERIDINDRYNNLQQSEHSDLVNRGLTASTVATSVAGSVEGARNKALGQLNDRLAMNNASVYSSTSGQALENQAQSNRYLGTLDYNTQTQIPEQMLNFAERRNDIYPNLAQYNQTQQGLGAASAAGLASASLAANQRAGSPYYG